MNNDPYNKLIIQEIKAWIEENLFGCNDYKKIASKWQRFSTKWNNSIKPSSIVHQDTTDNEKHSRTFRDPSLICGTIHQERHLRGYSLKLYDAGVDDNNGFNNLGDTSFRHDRLKSMRPAKGNFKLKLRTKKTWKHFLKLPSNLKVATFGHINMKIKKDTLQYVKIIILDAISILQAVMVRLAKILLLQFIAIVTHQVNSFLKQRFSNLYFSATNMWLYI